MVPKGQKQQPLPEVKTGSRELFLEGMEGEGWLMRAVIYRKETQTRCCTGVLREPEESLSHPQFLPALRTLSVTPVWQTLLIPEEILPFGTTWMKLEGMMLKRDKYCMTSLIRGI